jgi:hypothetical protein
LRSPLKNNCRSLDSSLRQLARDDRSQLSERIIFSAGLFSGFV